ncbi:MAG: hypothetical protein GQ582_03435 [Methyloprofundus sp.]|nr:hypothetical protein [Methyloprofundus sp.]
MIVCLLSILAWGWLSEHWVIACVIMILIAVSSTTSWRWQLKVEQFYRIGDFVTVLFIGVLVFFSVTESVQRPVFIVLEWLPIFFLPLLLAQHYSVQQLLPMGTLFYSKRKRERLKTLDFTLPYAAICWLAAGLVKEVSLNYFILSILGFSLMLWSERSKNSPALVWLMLISLAAGLSYWGQQGVRQVHGVLTEQIIEWMVNWQTDPFKSMTSIGDIGELKLSDKIEFRVKSDEAQLLMQASYDRYLGASWLATLRVFNEQAPNYLAQTSSPIKSLEVFQSLKQSTLLALPAGTTEIIGLEGATLQYTPLGAVKLTEAPDFISYQVNYTGLQINPSHEFDLQIPKQHQPWIETIKQALKLEGQSPSAIASAIEHYFHTQYYYSLFLGKESDPDKALQDFVLKRKAGHCEYFAVASVFLLRSYGIPARLANGYAMQEYNTSQQLYIVRRRHAHAWAIAQIEGYWQAVDSTPANWLAMEDQQADELQPLYDFFSHLYFIYKQWRYDLAMAEDEVGEQRLWMSIGLILVLILIWRLIISRRDLIKLNKKKDSSYIAMYPGLDSEFFLIEKTFAKTEKARLNNESIRAWLERIDVPELKAIAQLHYRYRFDEPRFSGVDRANLKQAVEVWLEKAETKLVFKQ